MRAKKDPRSCVRNASAGKKIPGAVLLSHSQIYSTIAAGALNCRVREGNLPCSGRERVFLLRHKHRKKIQLQSNVSTGDFRVRGLTTLS